MAQTGKKHESPLKSNIRIYGNLLDKFTKYVNDQWGMDYTPADIVGVDWGATFLFVHFKTIGNGYPIKHNFSFIPEVKD